MNTYAQFTEAGLPGPRPVGDYRGNVIAEPAQRMMYLRRIDSAVNFSHELREHEELAPAFFWLFPRRIKVRWLLPSAWPLNPFIGEPLTRRWCKRLGIAPCRRWKKSMIPPKAPVAKICWPNSSRRL